MIDFLVRLERLQSLRVYRQVLPVQVELRERVLILGDAPVELLLGDLFDERVFGFWSGELRTIGNLLKRFMMT